MNCKDLRIMLTLSLSTEKQEARRKQRDSQNSEKKSLNLELYKTTQLSFKTFRWKRSSESLSPTDLL